VEGKHRIVGLRNANIAAAKFANWNVRTALRVCKRRIQSWNGTASPPSISNNYDPVLDPPMILGFLTRTQFVDS